jgi:two-component system, cell cycle response regulator DivK
MPFTVLIVEDPMAGENGLAVLMQDRFDTVRTVGTAQEAIEVAVELRPDLVITPFPAVTASGDLLTAALKRDPRTSAAKVIAYSDWCWANTRAKALAAGCEAFVPVSAPVEELLAAVDGLVGGSTAGGASPTRGSGDGHDRSRRRRSPNPDRTSA